MDLEYNNLITNIDLLSKTIKELINKNLALKKEINSLKVKNKQLIENCNNINENNLLPVIQKKFLNNENFKYQIDKYIKVIDESILYLENLE